MEGNELKVLKGHFFSDKITNITTPANATLPSNVILIEAKTETDETKREIDASFSSQFFQGVSNQKKDRFLSQVQVANEECRVFVEEMDLNIAQNEMNLFYHLLEMKKDEMFVDVIIKVNGHKLWCHKFVLAASSPYFLHLFSQQSCNEVTLNINKFAFDVILIFMYTGLASINRNNVESVESAAQKLGIYDILDLCSEYKSNFLASNLLETIATKLANNLEDQNNFEQSLITEDSNLCSTSDRNVGLPTLEDNSENYTCRLCSMSYSNSNDLDIHYEERHPPPDHKSLSMYQEWDQSTNKTIISSSESAIILKNSTSPITISSKNCHNINLPLPDSCNEVEILDDSSDHISSLYPLPLLKTPLQTMNSVQEISNRGNYSVSSSINHMTRTVYPVSHMREKAGFTTANKLQKFNIQSSMTTNSSSNQSGNSVTAEIVNPKELVLKLKIETVKSKNTETGQMVNLFRCPMCQLTFLSRKATLQHFRDKYVSNITSSVSSALRSSSPSHLSVPNKHNVTVNQQVSNDLKISIVDLVPENLSEETSEIVIESCHSLTACSSEPSVKSPDHNFLTHEAFDVKYSPTTVLPLSMLSGQVSSSKITAFSQNDFYTNNITPQLIRSPIIAPCDISKTSRPGILNSGIESKPITVIDLSKPILQKPLIAPSSPDVTRMSLIDRKLINICDENAVDISSLPANEKKYTKSTFVGYICRSCTKFFDVKTMFLVHFKSSHPIQKSFKVIRFAFLNENEINLNTNKQNTDEETGYICKTCQHYEDSEEVIKGHMLFVHNTSGHYKALQYKTVVEHETERWLNMSYLNSLENIDLISEQFQEFSFGYICRICSQFFETNKSFMSHIKRHHPKQKFFQLIKYQILDENENPDCLVVANINRNIGFLCKICYLYEAKEDVMKTHMIFIHNKPNKYDRIVYTIVFDHETDGAVPLKYLEYLESQASDSAIDNNDPTLKLDESLFKLPIIENSLSDKRFSTEITPIDTTEYSDDKISGNPKDSIYVCDDCNEVFSSFNNLKLHLFEEEHTFHCTICKTFKTVNLKELYNHSKESHDVCIPKKLFDQLNKCPQCPFLTESLIKLRKHIGEMHSNFNSTDEQSKLQTKRVIQSTTDISASSTELFAKRLKLNPAESPLELSRTRSKRSIVIPDNTDLGTTLPIKRAKHNIVDVENILEDESSDCVQRSDITTSSTDIDKNLLEPYCHICKKTYSTLGNLKYHFGFKHKIIFKTMEKFYQCVHSNRISKESKQETYICLACDFVTPLSNEMTNHMKDVHKNSAPESPVKLLYENPEESEPSDEHRCLECRETFNSIGLLKSHLRKYNHGLKCVICNFKTTSILNFHCHNANEHQVPLPNEWRKSAFKCTRCDYIVDNSTALNDHVMKSHYIHKRLGRPPNKANAEAKKNVKSNGSENIIQTNMPQSAGASVTDGTEDIRKHDQKCAVCGWSCVGYKTLLEHRRESDHKLACDDCDYKTMDEDILIVHCINKHQMPCPPEADYLHLCSMCTFASITSAQMKKHMKIHPGQIKEKSFPTASSREKSIKHLFKYRKKLMSSEVSKIINKVSTRMSVSEKSGFTADTMSKNKETEETKKILKPLSDKQMTNLPLNSKDEISEEVVIIPKQFEDNASNNLKKLDMVNLDSSDDSNLGLSSDSIGICPFKCNECDNFFPTLTAVSIHRKVTKHILSCKNCSFTTCFDNIYYAHIVKHHKLPLSQIERKLIYKCSQCSHAEDSRTFLAIHVKKKHENLNNLTSIMISPSLSKLKSTSESSLSDTESETVTNDELNTTSENLHKPPLLFSCDVCKTTFDKKFTLFSHRQYTNHFLRCSFCGFKTHRDGHFICHLYNSHSVPVPKNDLHYTVPCQYCPTVYCYNSDLLVHMKSKHKSILFGTSNQTIAKGFSLKKLSVALDNAECENYLINNSPPKKNPKPFHISCDVCNKDFDCQTDLLSHRKDSNHFCFCLHCNLETFSDSLYFCHLYNKHGIPVPEASKHFIVICPRCSDVLAQESELMAHFQTRKCLYNSKKNSDVKSNKSSVESNESPISKHRSTLEAFLCCNICYLNFPTLSTLLKHRDSKQHLIKCDFCFYKTNNDRKFYIHIHNYHAITLTKQSESLVSKCFDCSHVELDFIRLQRHSKEWHNTDAEVYDIKKWPCNLCSFISADLNEFVGHNLKMHQTEKVNVCCSYCSYIYDSLDPDNVLEHLQNYHKEYIKDFEANVFATLSLKKCEKNQDTGNFKQGDKKSDLVLEDSIQNSNKTENQLGRDMIMCISDANSFCNDNVNRNEIESFRETNSIIYDEIKTLMEKENANYNQDPIEESSVSIKNGNQTLIKHPTCLFCSFKSLSDDEIKAHMKKKHLYVISDNKSCKDDDKDQKDLKEMSDSPSKISADKPNDVNLDLVLKESPMKDLKIGFINNSNETHNQDIIKNSIISGIHEIESKLICSDTLPKSHLNEVELDIYTGHSITNKDIEEESCIPSKTVTHGLNELTAEEMCVKDQEVKNKSVCADTLFKSLLNEIEMEISFTDSLTNKISEEPDISNKTYVEKQIDSIVEKNVRDKKNSCIDAEIELQNKLISVNTSAESLLNKTEVETCESLTNKNIEESDILIEPVPNEMINPAVEKKYEEDQTDIGNEIEVPSKSVHADTLFKSLLNEIDTEICLRESLPNKNIEKENGIFSMTAASEQIDPSIELQAKDQMIVCIEDETEVVHSKFILEKNSSDSLLNEMDVCIEESLANKGTEKQPDNLSKIVIGVQIDSTVEKSQLDQKIACVEDEIDVHSNSFSENALSNSLLNEKKVETCVKDSVTNKDIEDEPNIYSKTDTGSTESILRNTLSNSLSNENEMKICVNDSITNKDIEEEPNINKIFTNVTTVEGSPVKDKLICVDEKTSTISCKTDPISLVIKTNEENKSFCSDDLSKSHIDEMEVCCIRDSLANNIEVDSDKISKINTDELNINNTRVELYMKDKIVYINETVNNSDASTVIETDTENKSTSDTLSKSLLDENGTEICVVDSLINRDVKEKSDITSGFVMDEPNDSTLKELSMKDKKIGIIHDETINQAITKNPNVILETGIESKSSFFNKNEMTSEKDSLVIADIEEESNIPIQTLPEESPVKDIFDTDEIKDQTNIKDLAIAHETIEKNFVHADFLPKSDLNENKSVSESCIQEKSDIPSKVITNEPNLILQTFEESFVKDKMVGETNQHCFKQNPINPGIDVGNNLTCVDTLSKLHNEKKLNSFTSESFTNNEAFEPYINCLCCSFKSNSYYEVKLHIERTHKDLITKKIDLRKLLLKPTMIAFKNTQSKHSDDILNENVSCRDLKCSDFTLSFLKNKHLSPPYVNKQFYVCSDCNFKTSIVKYMTRHMIANHNQFFNSSDLIPKVMLNKIPKILD